MLYGYISIMVLIIYYIFLLIYIKPSKIIKALVTIINYVDSTKTDFASSKRNVILAN